MGKPILKPRNDGDLCSALKPSGRIDGPCRVSQYSVKYGHSNPHQGKEKNLLLFMPSNLFQTAHSTYVTNFLEALT